MHPGLPAATAAYWATVRVRHYSVSYLIVLALIAGVGYLTIRHRREHPLRSPPPYQPPQGRNEFELHPSPAPAPRRTDGPAGGTAPSGPAPPDPDVGPPPP